MASRILVVDDDRKIVRLVRSYLEDVGMKTYAAYEGDEALRVIRSERPDLVILDLMLPGRDGWDVMRAIRGDDRLAQTCVLMLTARVEDTDKIVGFNLGADDYLTKPFNPLELVMRARAILRRAGGNAAVSHVLEIGGVRLDVDYRTVSVGGRAVDMTPTEFALLKLLMENANHAFTRSELIERVLGYTYEGMERTIDTHIRNLRKKIEYDPAEPRLIETVFGIGYCLREDRPT